MARLFRRQLLRLLACALLSPACDDGSSRLATDAAIPSTQEDGAAVKLPPWAVAADRDQYGLWAEFEVHGVRSRLRHISAGTFMMGSPVSEQGRLDNELPH